LIPSALPAPADNPSTPRILPCASRTFPAAWSFPSRRKIANQESRQSHARSSRSPVRTRAGKRQAALSAERRGQIKTGDRSEKIRTYNFPQNRVTDHRIGLTLHQLTEVMDGKLAR